MSVLSVDARRIVAAAGGAGLIFRRKSKVEETEQPEIEYVLFQGPLNGNTPDLKANAKLTQAALIPTKELVTDAILRRAEMIRLDPKGPAALVRLYVDGIPYPAARMPRQQGVGVTQMIKLLSGLDIRERGKPQSGGLNAEHEGIKYEMRVQVAPGEGAERLIIRLENVKTRPERPEELGFSTGMRDKLRELIEGNSGALLCCGPPMSGVTVTTFGILRSLDPYTRTVTTLGETDGRKLIAMNPFEWNSGDTLETTIQRVLRTEPNVLYIDPVRDPVVAKTMFKFAEVVSFVAEFAAKDAPSGVQQLVQWAGDPNVVAESVRGIVSPKLIRKLCGNCKQVFKPNPKAIDKIGLPPETQVLYRPPRPPLAGTPEADAFVPCNKCGGIGYLGRTGIFEILEMTPGMKEVVLAGAPPQAIRQQMRKDGMQTLQKEALRLVAEGVTSLEEVQRVFQQPAA